MWIICTQLYGFKLTIIIPYKYLNSYIRPINVTLTGTTTSSLSGPGCNGNKWVLRIPLRDSTGVLPFDTIPCHIDNNCWAGVLPIYSDAVGVFWNPCWQEKSVIFAWLWAAIKIYLKAWVNFNRRFAVISPFRPCYQYCPREGQGLINLGISFLGTAASSRWE